MCGPKKNTFLKPSCSPQCFLFIQNPPNAFNTSLQPNCTLLNSVEKEIIFIFFSYIFLHARGAFLSRHQLYSQSYCQSCKRVVVVGRVDGGMHCFRSEPSFDITAIQELTVLHISRNGIRKKPLVVTNRVFYTITIIFPAQ